jgi:nucleoside-diphosphate-sugar epimerase
MRFSEIKTSSQLWEFMTMPSERLIESIRRLDGPVMILGGSGKMGKELVGLIRRADKKSGIRRDISVASTFSDPSGEDLLLFESLNVHCFRGDLSDEKFLASLPDAPNVVYMMGFKFGSSSDWQRSFHLNSIIPYLVGKKYEKSKIVVFSSGNPYPHTPKNGNGCTEDSPLSPAGIYGWSIVARESSYRITARQCADQEIAFYRLMYAQHLKYGVLIDLARMVWNGEQISLAMPAVNLVSQRDANEIAIRTFDYCSNDPWTINVAGPVWQVREIVERLEKFLGKKAILLPDESELALLADDSKCINTFGSYLDDVEDMIKGAAWWVKNGGNYWNKPTRFGHADHKY